MEYKSNMTGNIVKVSELNGMGKGENLGKYFVVYIYNTDIDHSRIMERKEFLRNFTKVG